MTDQLPTLTLRADQWRRLLAPVLPHASDEDAPPILQTVHLKVTTTHALATATDQFTMATQRVAIPTRDDDPQSEFAVLIHRADVRTFLDAHPAPAARLDDDCECDSWTEIRDETPITLTYDETRDVVHVDDDLRRLIFDTALEVDRFPRLDRIFADLIRRNTNTAPPSIVLTSWMFERWQQVGEEPARLFGADDPKEPVLITVGRDFIGAWAPRDFKRLAAQATPAQMWGEQYPDKLDAEVQRARAGASAGGAA